MGPAEALSRSQHSPTSPSNLFFPFLQKRVLLPRAPPLRFLHANLHLGAFFSPGNQPVPDLPGIVWVQTMRQDSAAKPPAVWLAMSTPMGHSVALLPSSSAGVKAFASGELGWCAMEGNTLGGEMY